MKNLRIDKYPRLKVFLKKKWVGHRPKKYRVLRGENIVRFISEA